MIGIKGVKTMDSDKIKENVKNKVINEIDNLQLNNAWNYNINISVHVSLWQAIKIRIAGKVLADLIR
ncbi:hypothetical protein LCGC14_1547900 [marine sediment metagenome]|uniref:Uncharacterized protein n=1 Tax=marine sediment metagenome TaxID=412755 RepID=A0A0F9IR67_9ZZZZ